MTRSIIPLFLALSTLLLSACEARICFRGVCIVLIQQDVEDLAADMDFGDYTLQPTVPADVKIDFPLYASLVVTVAEEDEASFALVYSAERGGYVLGEPKAFNAWFTANAGANIDVELLGLDDVELVDLAFVDSEGAPVLAWELDT